MTAPRKARRKAREWIVHVTASGPLYQSKNCPVMWSSLGPCETILVREVLPNPRECDRCSSVVCRCTPETLKPPARGTECGCGEPSDYCRYPETAAALAEAKRDADYWEDKYATQCREALALRAENERLREALHWALKHVRITDLNREAFGRVSALAGGKEEGK